MSSLHVCLYDVALCVAQKDGMYTVLHDLFDTSHLVLIH